MRRTSKFKVHVVALAGCGIAFLLILIGLRGEHRKDSSTSDAFIYDTHNVDKRGHYIEKKIKTKDNENSIKAIASDNESRNDSNVLESAKLNSMANLSMTSNGDNKSRSIPNVSTFVQEVTSKADSSLLSDKVILKPRDPNSVTTRSSLAPDIDDKSRTLTNVGEARDLNTAIIRPIPGIDTEPVERHNEAAQSSFTPNINEKYRNSSDNESRNASNVLESAKLNAMANLSMTSNGDNKSRNIPNVSKFVQEDTSKADPSLLSDKVILKPRDPNSVTTRSSLASNIDNTSRTLTNVGKARDLNTAIIRPIPGNDTEPVERNNEAAQSSFTPNINEKYRNAWNVPKLAEQTSLTDKHSVTSKITDKSRNIPEVHDSQERTKPYLSKDVINESRNPPSLISATSTTLTLERKAFADEGKLGNEVNVSPNPPVSSSYSDTFSSADSNAFLAKISFISDNDDNTKRTSSFNKLKDSNSFLARISIIPNDTEKFKKALINLKAKSSTKHSSDASEDNDKSRNVFNVFKPPDLNSVISDKSIKQSNPNSEFRPVNTPSQENNVGHVRPLNDILRPINFKSSFLKHVFERKNSKSTTESPSVSVNRYGSLRTITDKSVFSQLINKSNVSSAQACVHPHLDINEPQLANFFFSVPPIICNAEPDWLTIKNSIAYITPIYRKRYGNFDCEIRYILRNDDFSITLAKPIIMKSYSILHLKHDFFTCRCQVNVTMDEFKVYENIHAGISMKPDVHLRSKNIGYGLGLNVLMLGFDSLSHMTFMRKLKKTYGYFTDTLGGIVMNGYNIVGDGTPQALIPILTGKTELELPRTLQRLLERRYCDVFPMVWKDFQKKGYATAYGEDAPGLGTFTYRMNGFSNQPTDHYLRPFYMEAERRFFQMFSKYCLGSKRRSELFFDWIRQFFTMYRNKPRFAFGFHTELSHDHNNLVETADLDLQTTLINLNEAGHLNNTLLILMSDHGARFSEVRATLQGKQEERRPFFGFAFPKWFENKYPKIIQNMKINTNRLSTPFDIYFTLRDVLDYDDSTVNNISKRGMSLFKEIPKSRSCENAGIDDHWCACLEWRTLTTDDSNVLQAAESLLKHLNDLTSPHRQLCSELKLSRIVKAFTLLPKENMVKFKKTLGDGFLPELSDSTDITDVKYQIWIETTPGNGSFEATINYNTQNNVFIAHTDHISRVNKYGSDAKCIENINADLRKFCYCIT